MDQWIAPGSHPLFPTVPGGENIDFHLALYGIQSPINIGMILRVTETYHVSTHIFDENAVLQNPDKLKTVKDFSTGAFDRRPPNFLTGKDDLLHLAHRGRIICTSIEAGATPLNRFIWRENDIVLLGNEYDGLPESLMANADALLHIPMPPGWTPKSKSHSPIDPNRTETVSRDGTPNLNVAMSAGIICYAHHLEKLRVNARPT